jgi:hypothetical protein
MEKEKIQNPLGAGQGQRRPCKVTDKAQGKRKSVSPED